MSAVNARLSGTKDDGQVHADVRLGHVRAALTAGPYRPDWSPARSLFRRLPGYWAADVANDLHGLEIQGDAAAAEVLRVLRDRHAEDPGAEDPLRLLLPVPHPLDADWRFSVATRAYLLDQASSLAGDRGRTVLLGTPTLFAHACNELDLRRMHLVDANQSTVERASSMAGEHALLSAECADLTAGSDNLDRGSAVVVVADPPWYDREQTAFLRAASTLLETSGVLLLAAAAAGTRPGADRARRQLLDEASALGLAPFGRRERAVGYDAPPFERAALGVSSLPGIPTDWRRGDLLMFRRTEQIVVLPEARDSAGEPAGWIPVERDRVRIRVRKRTGPLRSLGGGSLRAEAAKGGPVRSSVSRRDTTHDDVDVWTSGNGTWRLTDDWNETDAVRALSSPAHPMTPEGTRALFDALDRELAQLERWGWA